jgi:hypothetical protein
MSTKFDDYFPLGFEVILDVEINVQHFVETPSQICCCPLCVKHKNEIKIKFITQHETQCKMLMYASLTNLEEIFPTKLISWNEISKCMFFVLKVLAYNFGITCIPFFHMHDNPIYLCKLNNYFNWIFFLQEIFAQDNVYSKLRERFSNF